jgi:LysM repeat protein
MNNPNPLIPQGSLLEQQARGKPHLRIALCIAAAHVVFLGLLLMQGCKREDDPLPATELTPEDFGFGRLDMPSLYTNQVEVEPPPRVVDVSPGVAGPTEGPPPITPALPPLYEVPPVVEPIVPRPVPEVPRVREHVVVSGDTYTSLARDYKTTISAIAKANPNADPTRLQVGQKLLIPPGDTTPQVEAQPERLPPGVEVYTVVAGDTLTSIAKAHGTTVSAIRELNQLTSDRILVNQKLKIPAANNASGAVRP